MNERHKPLGLRAKADPCGGDTWGDTWGAVGRRLALRRTELGHSVERIADAVGITAADYTDYESGAPIPAFLLGEIAGLLDRSVTWFFEGVAQQEPADSGTGHGTGRGAGLASGLESGPVTYKVATVEHRIQALTESFRKLDFEGQQHLLALSRALSRG